MTDIAKQLKESMDQASESTVEVTENSLSIAQQIADEPLRKLKSEVAECIELGLKEWIESGEIVADVLAGGRWKPDFLNGKTIAGIQQPRQVRMLGTTVTSR